MAASVWKGHLIFGMVSFPIRLFSAARSETISFNMLHKDDHSRIKQMTYCQLEDKPIPRSETVKGYEYEKDHYVVIDDEDIKKVAPRTAKVMEILEFVKADQVDPIYLESSYYVAPDEGGEKAYALLFTALKDSGYYGVGSPRPRPTSRERATGIPSTSTTRAKVRCAITRLPTLHPATASQATPILILRARSTAS